MNHDTSRLPARRFGREVDDTCPEAALLEAIGEQAVHDFKHLVKIGVIKSDGAIGKVSSRGSGHMGYYRTKQLVQNLIDLFDDKTQFPMMQRAFGIAATKEEMFREMGVDISGKSCDDGCNESGGE